MRVISDNTAGIFGTIIKFVTICVVLLSIYILTFDKISLKITPHIEFRYFQLKKFVYGAERQLGIASRCQSLGKEKYGFGGYFWERLTRNAEYGPRDGAAIAWHDEQLILVGGWHPHDSARAPRKTMNDVWRSKDGRSWQLLKESSYGIRLALLSGEWTGRH